MESQIGNTCDGPTRGVGTLVTPMMESQVVWRTLVTPVIASMTDEILVMPVMESQGLWGLW
jgi:hypothetical protein